MGRNTVQKDAIRAVFEREARPLRVAEVVELARRQAPSLDQATVYRNLKRLLAEGRLHKLSHPVLGALYERAGTGHHHHFHCRSCGLVTEVPGCCLELERAAPDGFLVEDHAVFLSGVCAGCRGAGLVSGGG